MQMPRLFRTRTIALASPQPAGCLAETYLSELREDRALPGFRVFSATASTSSMPSSFAALHHPQAHLIASCRTSADDCLMRVVHDDEYPEFIRRLREQARRDADELVPRPGCPVYGLAAPSLTPAVVAQTERTNGEWTLITLTYGRPEDVPAGPYVMVSTLAFSPDADTTGIPAGWHGTGVEGELRLAVEREQDRAGSGAGDAGNDGPVARGPAAEPAVAARELLPDGEALVVRQGIVWAARLLPGHARAAVTVVGRGVSPESVRIEQLPSLRPLIEARTEELIRRIEGNRGKPRPPRPVPGLPPAEGVAALRALADHTLATHAQIRASRGTGRSPGLGPAGLHWALWQRAIGERQRLAGEDERAAEDVVTSAVNHLGHLDSDAAWFTADARLREAAIDETLRYAMLDDQVPSERAQHLWTRYWAARTSLSRRSDPEPGERPAGPAADHETFVADWNAAWEAWSANA
jgi:hypothetical protein